MGVLVGVDTVVDAAVSVRLLGAAGARGAHCEYANDSPRTKDKNKLSRKSEAQLNRLVVKYGA